MYTRIAPISPCSVNGSCRHHYFPILHQFHYPSVVNFVLTMDSQPKPKKLLAPIFLDDPTKSSPIHVEHSHYSSLNSNSWLGTTHIDYLIQRFITPFLIGDNTLIPSYEFMDQISFKIGKLVSNKRGHKASEKKTRMKLNFFSSKEFRIIATTVLHGHFLYYPLLLMQHMKMYYLHINNCRKEVHCTSIAAQYLMRIQQFLNESTFHNIPIVYYRLKVSKELILKIAQYKDCPIQQNSHDCSLFGLITLIHLAEGKAIDSFTFSQSDITNFQDCLFKLMQSDPTKELFAIFVSEFFPTLCKEVLPKGVQDNHVLFHRKLQKPIIEMRIPFSSSVSFRCKCLCC
jgi:hypothetical protein